MAYPQHLLKLIQVLKRLPGVGNKTAERYAFQLLNWKLEHLKEFVETLSDLPVKIKACEQCGCLIDETFCIFCSQLRQQDGHLCVIASPKDALAIEQTREYSGLYHVLGGTLSPLDGIGPEHLRISELKARLNSLSVQEVILAFSTTLEGDATSLYLKRELHAYPIKVSRLALGIPVGSSLDYVDGSTLARALSARGLF